MAVYFGRNHLCRDQRSVGANVQHHLHRDHRGGLPRSSAHFTVICYFQGLSAMTDAFCFREFQVFIETDKKIIREKSSFFCILFVVMGLVTFFTMFLQVGVHGILLTCFTF